MLLERSADKRPLAISLEGNKDIIPRGVRLLLHDDLHLGLLLCWRGVDVPSKNRVFATRFAMETFQGMESEDLDEAEVPADEGHP